MFLALSIFLTMGWLNTEPKIDNNKDVTLIFYNHRVDQKTIFLLEQLKDTKNQIILLTTDNKSKAEKFVEVNKITYSVGYGLKNFRKYKIRSLPHVCSVKWNGENTIIESNISFKEYPNPRLNELTKLLPSATLDERMKYLKEISEIASSDEIAEVCAVLLEMDPPTELNHFVKTSIYYGDVSKIQQNALFPGLITPTSAEIAELQKDIITTTNLEVYAKTLKNKNLATLEKDYFDRSSSDSLSLLSRIEIIGEMENRDPVEAKNLLFKFYDNEKDSYIRWHLIGAVGYLTKPNDKESDDVCDKLFELMNKETDSRRVKPILKELILYLQSE